MAQWYPPSYKRNDRLSLDASHEKLREGGYRERACLPIQIVQHSEHQ